MSRLSTPDTLIGIGGGGSGVVYEYMQQRWILDEVLDDRTDIGGNKADNLTAVAIDTDTHQRDWHEEMAHRVEATFDEAVSDSVHQSADDILQFHGPHILPSKLSDEWEGDRKNGSEGDHFFINGTGSWLATQDDRIATVLQEEFDNGVRKIRGLGKAVYNRCTNENIDVLPDNIGEEVCMVATLGGGTGSGMILDLAADIARDCSQIHLLGILPHEDSGQLEKVNAHAALSELEYVELNGESPFESVSLIPHIQEEKDSTEDFDLAVVRSIVALNQIAPGRYPKPRRITPPWGSAEFAPFQLAVPYTIKFDLEAVREAREAAIDFLDRKNNELEIERELYGNLKTYLESTFDDTIVTEVLENPSLGTMKCGWRGDEEALRLEHRIEEDVLDTMLSQNILKVVSRDLVETLKMDIAHTTSPESIQYSEDASPEERARTYIECVPDRTLVQLKNEKRYLMNEEDGISRKLVKALTKEFENIRTRRNIWEAASTIDSNIVDLEPMDAKLIRRAIIDVTLDSEKEFLRKNITGPTIEERISHLADRRKDLREKRSRLESFWATVTDEIATVFNHWLEASYDSLETIATINKNRELVDTGLSQLEKELEDRVAALNDSTEESEIQGLGSGMKSLGPFESDKKTIASVSSLNDRLANIGVKKIPVDEIEESLKLLKEARILQLQHGQGIFPFSKDNTEEFAALAAELERLGWFSIITAHERIDIDAPFEAELTGNKLQRSAEIEEVRIDAITNIVTDFEDVVTHDGSLPVYGEDDIEVPMDISFQRVKSELESELRASYIGDAEVLVDSIFPPESLDKIKISNGNFPENTNNGSAFECIVRGYLQPIAKEHEEVQDRLDILGSSETNGVIHRLKWIRELAEGGGINKIHQSDTSLDYPENPITGRDFANRYEGLYEIDEGILDDFIYSDSPYVRYEETPPEYLISDPEHVGETDIHNDDIISHDLRYNVVNLLENDQRLPLSDLDLMGTGEYSDPTYPYTRIRQVYLSLMFDGVTHQEKGLYDQIYDSFNENIGSLRKDIIHDSYMASAYPQGQVDDITMVSFVGGVFLDNISLITGSDGYRDAYEVFKEEGEFVGSHHTIGLGGRWDRWQELGEWVAETTEQGINDCGAYVFRETTCDLEPSFVEEINTADESDSDSVTDIFLDKLTHESFYRT